MNGFCTGSFTSQCIEHQILYLKIILTLPLKYEEFSFMPWATEFFLLHCIWLNVQVLNVNNYNKIADFFYQRWLFYGSPVSYSQSFVLCCLHKLAHKLHGTVFMCLVLCSSAVFMLQEFGLLLFHLYVLLEIYMVEMAIKDSCRYVECRSGSLPVSCI